MSHRKEPSLSPPPRTSVLRWGLVIGGLLLANLILFGFFFHHDPQTVRQLRFGAEYRHWPPWYSTNLWLLVAGLAAITFLKTERGQNGIKALYASRFWRSGVAELRNGTWNRACVRLLVRRKFSKRMLRGWIHFWQRLRVDRYDRYAARLTVTGLILVTLCYSDWLAPIRVFFLYRTNRIRYFFRWLYESFYLTPLTSYFVTGVVTWRVFIAPVTGILLIVWLLIVVRKLKKRRARHD